MTTEETKRDVPFCRQKKIHVKTHEKRKSHNVRSVFYTLNHPNWFKLPEATLKLEFRIITFSMNCCNLFPSINYKFLSRISPTNAY